MAKKQYQPTPLKKPRNQDVTVEIPQGQFSVNFYANTFGIENIDGNKLLHFGFVMPSNRTMGAWACVLDAQMIAVNQENWLKYLSEIEYPKQESIHEFRCPPEATNTGVPFANLGAMARSGDVAETRFLCYCMGDVIEDQRTFHLGKVKGQPVGIVRSSLELQRQFIVALYGELLP